MFSGNLLTVFVNCALLEKRIVPLPDYCPGPKINLNIIAGSGCLTKELSPCQTGFNVSDIVSIINCILHFRDHCKMLN